MKVQPDQFPAKIDFGGLAGSQDCYVSAAPKFYSKDGLVDLIIETPSRGRETRLTGFLVTPKLR
ncbi:MAG TPA: hypothetical protein VNH11_31725 [Pirellulales bacterium]|nr:hypothetical protein [Pirellulales bacterium]